MEALKEQSALNRQARPKLAIASLVTPQFQAMRLRYEARKGTSRNLSCRSQVR